MEWLEDIKVLIADDHDHSIILAKNILEKMWIDEKNIFITTNWLDTVKKAKEELFDIIIMDLSMPLMSWVEAAVSIKAHHNGNSPKIIAYTADVYFSKSKWIEIMDGIMVKPVYKEPFQKMILEVLDEKLLKKNKLEEVTIGN